MQNENQNKIKSIAHQLVEDRADRYERHLKQYETSEMKRREQKEALFQIFLAAILILPAIMTIYMFFFK